MSSPTPSSQTAIRTAVRAVIIRDGHLLVQHKVYAHGEERYALPGGAQDLGESLEEALIRECEEEIGATVTVADLLHVADYRKPRNTEPPSTRQQVEFLFRCHVPETYEAQNGPEPDIHQVDVIWTPLHTLDRSLLIPKSFRGLLKPGPSTPVYQGWVD